MTYQKKSNPYADANGRISPANVWKARAFAKAEDEKYLASLSDDERADVLRQRRQLQDHMNISTPAEHILK